MKEKIIEKFNSVQGKAKTFAISTTAIGATVLSSVPVFAAEGTTTGLDSTVQTAISNGFTSATGAITTIVGLGVTATVGIIAVTGGAKAGLKWVKGAFSKAS